MSAIVGRWLLRHRDAAAAVHGRWHRRGRTTACFMCRAVWDAMLAEPGFRESLDRGIADIEAGRTVKWSELRKEMKV